MKDVRDRHSLLTGEENFSADAPICYKIELRCCHSWNLVAEI
jgi:hypothetical protein